jgi:DNA polymerase-3 subunit epsilon
VEPLAATYPPPRTPWREAEFCVVDLETTGLDPATDEIISWAALQIAGGRLRVGDLRYQLVHPRRMPDAETIVIHGLREIDLAGAPTLSETLDGLLEALAGKVLVAHVASVERGFLEAAFSDRGLELSNPIVDTDRLAAELLRKRGRRVPETIGLEPLAGELGLPVHRPHSADGDALTTAQVFLALATHLDALRPQTVGSLRRPGGRWPALRRSLRRGA